MGYIKEEQRERTSRRGESLGREEEEARIGGRRKGKKKSVRK